MKKDAWTKIEAEFNCQCIDSPRSAVVLKNKYENIKRTTKKQYADEKAYHRGTGGGPHKLFNSPSINSTVGEILQTRMTGEESIYDSDRVLETDYSLRSVDEDMLGENIIVINPADIDSTGKLIINYYFTFYLLKSVM